MHTAFNTSAEFTPTTKGETYCRPTQWTDVVKFFLLNYGLHAMTVVQEPGAGILSKVTTTLLAIVMPYFGIIRAALMISSHARTEKTPLRVALKAGALCTVVHVDDSTDYCNLPPILPQIINIHGQHPVLKTGFLDLGPVDTARSKDTNLHPYRLVQVPKSFDVDPLIENPDLQLSCNYSILSAAAAIIQIISSSFELYQARGNQLERFGYAAYSLTTIPYIMMSFTNLLATCCTPQYPSTFIVLYGGLKREGGTGKATSVVENDQAQEDKIQPAPVVQTVDWTAHEWKEVVDAKISGAVGRVYGEFPKAPAPIWGTSLRAHFILILVWVVFGCAIATPYMIMKLLTDFKPGQSTVSQRWWILAWLVVGQSIPLMSFALLLGNRTYFRYSPLRLHYQNLFTCLLLSVGLVGGSVSVARMMLQIEVVGAMDYLTAVARAFIP